MSEEQEKDEFNPSSRNAPREYRDLIGEAIKEAGIKFAEVAEKEAMIMIIERIREKLLEDPTFAEKLRTLLEMDKRPLMKHTKYEVKFV